MDDRSSVTRLPDKIGPYDFESFAHRIIQDAIEQATVSYWRNRADQLEACASQSGDFHGQSTPEERATRDERLRATAFACRARAALIEGGWF